MTPTSLSIHSPKTVYRTSPTNTLPIHHRLGAFQMAFMNRDSAVLFVFKEWRSLVYDVKKKLKAAAVWVSILLHTAHCLVLLLPVSFHHVFSCWFSP